MPKKLVFQNTSPNFRILKSELFIPASRIRPTKTFAHSQRYMVQLLKLRAILTSVKREKFAKNKKKVFKGKVVIFTVFKKFDTLPVSC